MGRHFLIIASLTILSGCVTAAHTGTLTADGVTNSVDSDTLDMKVGRQSFSFGTVFDFRALRLVSSFEMVTKKTSLVLGAGQQADPSVGARFEERQLYRLDLPVLALWDFEGGGLGYPGTMPHRHSFDLWLRAGTATFSQGRDGFLGAALTYYETDWLAFSLTLDRWVEPGGARAFSAEGVVRSFDENVAGWVLGFEVTVSAGEHALDIVTYLLEQDVKIRQRRRWR